MCRIYLLDAQLSMKHTFIIYYYISDLFTFFNFFFYYLRYWWIDSNSSAQLLIVHLSKVRCRYRHGHETQSGQNRPFLSQTQNEKVSHRIKWTWASLKKKSFRIYTSQVRVVRRYIEIQSCGSSSMLLINVPTIRIELPQKNKPDINNNNKVECRVAGSNIDEAHLQRKKGKNEKEKTLVSHCRSTRIKMCSSDTILSFITSLYDPRRVAIFSFYGYPRAVSAGTYRLRCSTKDMASVKVNAG